MHSPFILPCGRINGEWTSLYGRICPGITLWYDTIQTEMRMAKRDNGSSVSYTTRPFVRRPPALCWQMIPQLNKIWSLNNTLESIGHRDWLMTKRVYVSIFYSCAVHQVCSWVSKKECSTKKQCKLEMAYHRGCETNWLIKKESQWQIVSYASKLPLVCPSFYCLCGI